MIKNLKKLMLLSFFTVVFATTHSQTFIALDSSPHDISYYRESKITKPVIKVFYGRPTVAVNSNIFGEIIPFNEVWRTGANEATEVKLYKDIVFGDTKVKAGTYVLYTIPAEKEWKVILSSNLDVLGSFQYDPLFNVAEMTVPVTQAESLTTFSIAFKKVEEYNLQMVLAWGKTRVKIPMKIEPDNYFAEHINNPKEYTQKI